MQNQRGIAYLLGSFASLACAEGRVELAVRLHALSETRLESIGAVRSRQSKSEAERELERLRAALGSAAFERAWEEGNRLVIDEAIRLSLGEEAGDREGVRGPGT